MLSITEQEDRRSNYFVVSFNVRSEKLARLEAPKTLIDHRCTLIEYQGKLGLMCCQKGVEIWVTEDVGKEQEWSKIIFYDMDGFKDWHIACATHDGEIVFVDRFLTCINPLSVFYNDPNRNSLRHVEFRGTMLEHKCRHPLRVWAVPDHVENNALVVSLSKVFI